MCNRILGFIGADVGQTNSRPPIDFSKLSDVNIGPGGEDFIRLAIRLLFE